MRTDFTTDRVEVVRGGSASTLASNAPGAIINFVSKAGRDVGNAVGVTTGLGSRLNRYDFNYGGRIGQDMYFNLGGFFNIGRGVLDIDAAEDGEVVVLELSSYQTDLARSLTPDIAVFTNLSPDHLDRHAGMGGYFAAKRRLFAEGGPDRAIVGVDEVEGRFLANQLSEGPQDDRVIRISSGSKLEGFGWSVFARKGFLAEWRRGKQGASIDLREVAGLPGAHNHQNACAAYAACRSLGIAPRLIEGALQSFAGLPHRSQIVGEKAGVRFINDSKATNVDSAAKALQAFGKIRWIAGGMGKDGGIAALQPFLGSVVKAYLIGHSARDFALQLGDTPHEICETMERAVARAAAEAEAGEVVLLAPAAASFDQYPNFEKRGDDFAAQVKAQVQQVGAACLQPPVLRGVCRTF